MSYFYAVVDDDGRITGRSQLSASVSASNMITIDSLDQDLDGKLWSGTAWVDDTDPPAPSARLRLTRGEFRDLFTMDEQRAIYGAEATSVDVRIYLDDLRSREHVDLDNPKTVGNVNALEAMGLIATGRADEILAGVTD